MIKLDIHIHSYYSFDCLSSPEKIVKSARAKGLNGIAIADHNVFRVNWSKLKNENTDMIIIPATEIGTTFGDVLGYFIHNEITTKDFFEVIDEIHKQEGIAVLAHPFQSKERYTDEVFKLIDGIEVYNAQNYCNQQRLIELGKKINKPFFAGSDAHFLAEIGLGINEIDISFEMAKNADKLKEAILTRNTAYCRKGYWWSKFISQGIRVAKIILGK